MGFHFLLQCMKVKSESEVAQSCPTLRDPMDCSLLGSSVHGIFQAMSTGMGCHCLLTEAKPASAANPVNKKDNNVAKYLYLLVLIYKEW